MFESIIVSGQIHLGKQGEHCARRFSFQDVVIWKEIFGDGRCELIHQRNGDSAPYPVALTIENGVPYWCVTEVDTTFAGVGKCEVRYIVDDVVVKSNIYTTFVQEALGEGTEAPEPQKAWVDEVIEAGAKAKQSANDADASKSASEEYAEQSKGYAEEAETHSQNAQNSANSATRDRELSSMYAEETKGYADNASQNAEIIKGYSESVSANTQVVIDKADEIKGYSDNVTSNTQIVNEKAEEVTENANFVKGVLNDLGNALKGTASGVGAVKIDNVSALPHNIDIKTDVPTTFKSYGKNLTPYNIDEWVISGSDAFYSLDIPHCEVVITLWRNTERGTFDLNVYDENGKFVEYIRFYATAGFKKSIRIPYKDGYTYKLNTTKTALNLITDGTLNVWFQVEVGSATEYEEYKTPIDGVVAGYSTTTLIADTPGVNIEVTYNKDINNVIADLTAAIISLGGNV